VFERRLKVFLGVLILVTLTLVLRAAQVQVLQHKDWAELATDAMTRREQIETRRGAIRDYQGRVIAEDEPCVDACVDYRSLVPNPDDDWVKEVARGRLKDRMAGAYTDAAREKQKRLLEAEMAAVRKDIREMIPRLAKITGRDEQKLEDVRNAVVEKVRMRQRFIWYRNYELAMKRHADGVQQAATRPTSVWQRWLLEEGEDEAPELDKFVLKVSEQTAKHALIRDIELEMRTEIGKHIDRFPGLELKPGMRRIYPLGRVAAHLLGRMSRVTKDDIQNDPNFSVNELRQYQQTDLIGRGGLEGLCEPVLRGTRGEIARVDGREVSAAPPAPGQDVYCSIDAELQDQVEALFERVPIKTKLPDRDVVEEIAMHGAAVVIDVASGEVRVMASAPDFDPNTLDDEWAKLSADDNLDLPLMNRATLALREPGSTVKPMVGMAAAAYGVRRPDEGYECTGYMVVNGRYYRTGRCWVNSMFHNVLCHPGCKLLPCPAVAHHPVPYDAKHPTGFLTLADALERSCNPYFESIAHALGPYRLTDWYKKFGLGTKTYIGIAEAAGRLPVDEDGNGPTGPSAMLATWTAGIGQGRVNVTPLQMANVAATIARNGVWVRPKLLRQNFDKGGQGEVPPTTQAADRVDLGIPPEALAAVKEGMWRVVHTKAGSGGDANRKEVSVSGKTGTAEAAWIPLRDKKTGKVLRDEKGKPLLMALSSHDAPNPDAPWYRATGRLGDRPHHSWFMGFAPSEKPQIAFAVMVEYGGSGGGAAGSVASEIVKLCIDHKYLKVPDRQPVAAAPLAPVAEVELLHDVPATTRAAR
jgi:penicillin-binding protein 2